MYMMDHQLGRMRQDLKKYKKENQKVDRYFI